LNPGQFATRSQCAGDAFGVRPAIRYKADTGQREKPARSGPSAPGPDCVPGSSAWSARACPDNWSHRHRAQLNGHGPVFYRHLGTEPTCMSFNSKLDGRVDDRAVTDRKVLTPEEIWRRYDGIESRLTAPLSERMLDLAGIRPGMRVLDLATGRGEPALRAARRVAPDGFVVGVELADGVLEMARAPVKNRM